MYQIVASDLDGTLLNPDHRLSDFTKQVLQALRARKIHFIFATGRHHIDVAQMCEGMKIDAFMITSNGARVHNSQGELILSKSLPQNIALALAQVAMDNRHIYTHIYTHIYRGDDWLINKEDSYSLSFFEESTFTYQLFNPNDFPTDNIAKMYFTITDGQFHSQLAALKEQLENRFADKINVVFSTMNCLEVMAGGVSKGAAFQYVADLLGYGLEETIAFGDGMNDYEILSIVGKGCIMRNAPDMLKNRLPELEIIGSNADDAVSHYLQDLFLK